MKFIEQKLEEYGVVPVVVLKNTKDALPRLCTHFHPKRKG